MDGFIDPWQHAVGDQGNAFPHSLDAPDARLSIEFPQWPDDGSNVMDTMGMIDTSFDNVAGFGSFGGASNISMDTSPSTLFASGFRPGEDLGQHQMNDGQGGHHDSFTSDHLSGGRATLPYAFPQQQEAHPSGSVDLGHRDSHQAGSLKHNLHASLTSRSIAATPPLPAGPVKSKAAVPISRCPPPRMGPVSSQVQVPPRPKPGRKPMPPDKASDRRRLQNRIAQRNFRDKRQQKVCELNEEINDLKSLQREEAAEYERNAENARRESRRLEKELAELRAQLHLAKSTGRCQICLHQCSNKTAEQSNLDHTPTAAAAAAAVQEQSAVNVSEMPSISNHQQTPNLEADQPLRKPTETQSVGEITFPTPPEDNWQEIDMTEAWQRQRNVPEAQQSGDAWMSYGMDADQTGDSRCGFCTDDGNCACKASTSAVAAAAPTTTASNVNATSSSGPGTCDMCQQDPERAEACRSLANQTRPSPSKTVAEGDAAATKMMSCGQLLDRFGRDVGRLPSVGELLGPLHAYPAASGFSVDEHEAAQVLQGMAGGNAMARPARG